MVGCVRGCCGVTVTALRGDGHGFFVDTDGAERIANRGTSWPVVSSRRCGGLQPQEGIVLFLSQVPPNLMGTHGEADGVTA
jgi:hypothetical protein